MQRLIDIGPALLIVMVGIVALWSWRSKFSSSEEATEKDQQFHKAMTPIFVFAALCFIMVGVIYIFNL